MKKRWLSLFLAAVMLMSLLPSVVPEAGAETTPPAAAAEDRAERTPETVKHSSDSQKEKTQETEKEAEKIRQEELLRRRIREEKMDRESLKGRDILTLSLNTELQVTISEQGGGAVLSYTPMKTGWYELRSIGDLNLYGYIYDEDGYWVASDYGEDHDGNIQLRGKLQAGETYYFELYFYEGVGPGSFTVLLTEYEMPTSGTCGANLTWNYNEASCELSIEGSGGMYNWEWGKAPWSMFAREITKVSFSDAVTSIGDYAFYECYALSSAELPAQLTSIGDYAFDYCYELESVTIPASVYYIGRCAYTGCSSLQGFQIAEGNAYYSVRDGVLFNQDGTELLIVPGGKAGEYTIPENVTKIGECSFTCCWNLTGVTIPNGVTSIGEWAFEDCGQLTSLEIPDSVTEIEAGAFSSCYNLRSVRLPANLKSLPNYVFQCCNQLQQIDLPAQLQTIGEYTLYECSSLTEVTIPLSVTQIGYNAFRYCYNLSSLTILNRDCWISYGSETTLGDPQYTTIYAGENSTAQEYAEEYGYAFEAIDLCAYGVHNYEIADQRYHTETEEGWRLWVCVDCGDEYTEITPAGHVFTCTGYTDLWYGTLQCIYCDKTDEGDASTELTLDTEQTVEITENCDQAWLRFTPKKTAEYQFTSLGYWDTICYMYRANGEYLSGDDDSGSNSNFRIRETLEEGETYYFMVRFYGGGGEGSFDVLLTEYVLATSGVCGPTLTWSMDLDTGTLSIEGSGRMYDYDWEDMPWYELRDNITAISFPDELESIGGFAFVNCNNLESAEFPQNLSRIGYNAFYGCRSLRNVTIPAGTVSVGERAFAYCELLPSIQVAAANPAYISVDGVLLTKDGKELLQCPGGKSGAFSIPEGVETICEVAFGGCFYLTEVTIPDGVTSIETWAFENCDSLTSLEIPDSVEELGYGAISDCSELITVRFPAGLETMPSWVCQWCTSLQQAILPEQLKWIDNGAFYCCSSLTGIMLPDTVQEIQGEAFASCSSLTKVVLPQSLQLIEGNAFAGCSRLKTLFLQKNVEYIGPYAFWGCGQLEEVTIPKSVQEIGEYAFGYGEGYIEEEDSWGVYKVKDFTIRGFLNTAAEAYAEENEFNFIPLQEFSDVPENKYYYDAVLWAVANGVTSGTGGGKFSPSDPCTRGQIVTFLHAANGKPEPDGTVNPFTDVKAGKWYYQPVLWAYYHDPQITGGTTPTTFGVGDGCTREQAMTFLWKAAGAPEPESTENPFTDVKDNKWYTKAILWAVENGITSGTSPTTFGFGKTCTRAQIVTFLFKAEQIK